MIFKNLLHTSAHDFDKFRTSNDILGNKNGFDYVFLSYPNPIFTDTHKYIYICDVVSNNPLIVNVEAQYNEKLRWQLDEEMSEKSVKYAIQTTNVPYEIWKFIIENDSDIEFAEYEWQDLPTLVKNICPEYDCVVMKNIGEEVIGGKYTDDYCIFNPNNIIIKNKLSAKQFNPIKENKMLNKKKKIYITENQYNKLFEVRYLQPNYSRYGGKVQSDNWFSVYNENPIKNSDKIRVFHGCSLETALDICLHGTSGYEWHPRTYSYESGMNPLGIFVTTNFYKATDFGNTYGTRCVIEFTASANDLETPVWNNSDSYFGQGSNPMPFHDKEERNAQKLKYHNDALNMKDDDYYDVNSKQFKPLSSDFIRKSDKPAMAKNIFMNNENQALFMGNLNANQIKRVWVEEKGKGPNYIPMKPNVFVKKFYYKKEKEYQDKLMMKWGDNGFGYEHKLYQPNENFQGWDDLYDRYAKLQVKNYGYDYESSYKLIKEIFEKNLIDKDNINRTFINEIKIFMWPKQIIQAYGKDFFDDNYNFLGQ